MERRPSGDNLTSLVETKIRERTLNLAVIGAGYVGLPTAAVFSNAGFRVVAVDKRADVVSAINSGRSLTRETALGQLVHRNFVAGRLNADTDTIRALRTIDSVIVAVQTPITERRKPNISYLIEALDKVGGAIKKGTLICIVSTVPLGTTVGIIKSQLEKCSDLRAESDFFLAYTPERMSPGKAVEEFVKSPRLVGGIGPRSTRLAALLFRTVCNSVIETDASTAEVAKLAENTFRDVNIAFANQLALICEHACVDALDVIRFANTHPRISIHTPGPGVGGPCLTKDPYMLNTKTDLRRLNLIVEARRINDFMPDHIVDMVLESLQLAEKDPPRTRVAILGVAYKGNVDDSRESPARQVITRLIDSVAEVRVFDPYCTTAFGATSFKSIRECVGNVDCLVTMTDHSQFHRLDLSVVKRVMNTRPVIVDGRRIVDPRKARAMGFIYRGIGLGKLLTIDEANAGSERRA
jgi:UDP-N-acetyl-D-mannosaminuronic acid dehydrogenase